MSIPSFCGHPVVAVPEKPPVRISRAALRELEEILEDLKNNESCWPWPQWPSRAQMPTSYATTSYANRRTNQTLKHIFGKYLETVMDADNNLEWPGTWPDEFPRYLPEHPATAHFAFYRAHKKLQQEKWSEAFSAE